MWHKISIYSYPGFTYRLIVIWQNVQLGHVQLFSKSFVAGILVQDVILLCMNGGLNIKLAKYFYLLDFCRCYYNRLMQQSSGNHIISVHFRPSLSRRWKGYLEEQVNVWRHQTTGHLTEGQRQSGVLEPVCRGRSGKV